MPISAVASGRSSSGRRSGPASSSGIFAPAGTPDAVVTLLNTELRRIIDSAEVKAALGTAGFEAFSSSPKELDDFAKALEDVCYGVARGE